MFAVKSSEMRIIDQFMIEQNGLPSLVLMENAARSVVDIISTQYPKETIGQSPIVVLCGSGNNGGDGLVIARWLKHLGYPVIPVMTGNIERLSPDCLKEFEILTRFMAHRQEGPVLKWVSEQSHEGESGQCAEILEEDLARLLRHSSLIVDAILGTGCDRTLTQKLYNCVEMMNQSGKPIVAVDVPTGINSDTGQIMGAAVKATITVTFCLPKLGLVLYPGAEYVGTLRNVDIGIQEEALLTLSNPVELLSQEKLQRYYQFNRFHRLENTHKGSFGSVGVIAGDKHMLGATILAVKAAYRTGAGLVKVFIAEEYALEIIRHVPECVVVPYDAGGSKEQMEKALESFKDSVQVLTIGPGLSTSVHARHLVEQVLRMDCKVVIDADGLNIISQNMESFAERQCECVITPHIGEMARLTGYITSGIADNTLKFAEAFNQQYQVTVVLKSARTIIVTKNKERYINLMGNNGMATGGSGDVLTGVIAGFIAQGYSVDDSAVYGTMLHSYSGDYTATICGEHRVMAGDMVDNLWCGLATS